MSILANKPLPEHGFNADPLPSMLFKQQFWPMAFSAFPDKAWTRLGRQTMARTFPMPWMLLPSFEEENQPSVWIQVVPCYSFSRLENQMPSLFYLEVVSCLLTQQYSSCRKVQSPEPHFREINTLSCVNLHLTLTDAVKQCRFINKLLFYTRGIILCWLERNINI